MKENWTEQLRRKLEGHRMPPPEGLWEDISRQMDKPSGLKPLSRLTGTAQRWWAAAAAVLALVGVFVFYNGNDSEPPQQANAVTQQPSPQDQGERLLDSVQNHGPIPVIHPALAQTSSPHHAAKQEQEEAAMTIDQGEEPLPPEPAVPTSSEDRQTESAQPQNHQPHQENRLQDSPDKWLTEQSSLASTHRWSVGLNASGGLLAANTPQRTDRVYQLGNILTENSFFHYTGLLFTQTDYVVKHHLPIRFGLSVQYQLNDYLALHSGISYTYLCSELSIPLYQNISYSQKLHYLGVPLGVTWQLWSAHRFRFYLSGGMMLEKCVSADLEGSSIESKKPWQWSVAAAVGAEYTFIRQVGLYLEPSLGYYFDDGTSLEHYYKEHPLAPSIEFGLRLHFDE